MRTIAWSRAALLGMVMMYGVDPATGDDRRPGPRSEIHDHLTFHRRSVDVPNDPRRIDWIKLDISDALKLHDARTTLEAQLQSRDPYRRRLPFEKRHAPKDLEELRADPEKFYDTYYRELQDYLKDQFYAWEELNRIAVALEEMRRENDRPVEWYIVRVRLKEPVNGIAQVNYAVSSYLEAKTMADDVRQGVIKSFTVYAENLAGVPSDQKQSWEPCGSACWISAFTF